MTHRNARHVSDGHDVQAETTERLAAAVHDGVDRVAERARDIEHTLRERGAVLGEQARKHEQSARIAVADHMKTASAYVRKQSISPAMAVAAVVGVVIGGWLVLRR